MTKLDEIKDRIRVSTDHGFTESYRGACRTVIVNEDTHWLIAELEKAEAKNKELEIKLMSSNGKLNEVREENEKLVKELVETKKGLKIYEKASKIIGTKLKEIDMGIGKLI